MFLDLRFLLVIYYINCKIIFYDWDINILELNNYFELFINSNK